MGTVLRDTFERYLSGIIVASYRESYIFDFNDIYNKSYFNNIPTRISRSNPNLYFCYIIKIL